ncbi:RecF/RecN/SMC protein [Hymenopellis radicata]|nr:RecF/RecN/SMC protein [Hymenopellis radicata]
MEADEEEAKPAKQRKGSKPPSRRAPLPEGDDDDVKPDPIREPSLPAVSEDIEDGPDVARKTDNEREAQLEDLSARIPATQSQATFEEPKGPRQRLVISNIVLVNFKSYAGRQEIGPFHKSFSSIVGPNGSGKSNTIDALLFVFGFRANKMRQAKLSELIHHSANYPDLQQCSVEVHFREIIDLEGPDDFEVVPGSQLVVTRTAFKDNTSKYTVNKKQVAHKEVRELLLSRGIDLDHNRFLILQGEVESIALMKPKGGENEEGLLEYLEDIIGTATLKEPIEQALAKVEEIQEARAEKLNRLRLVEKERDALKEKKKEVDAWYKISNECTKAQSKLYQFEIFDLFLKEERLSKKLATQEALQEEEERNKENIAKMEEVEAKYNETKKNYEDVRDLAAKLNQEHTQQAKKKAKGDEQRRHAKSKVKKLQKTVTDDEATLAEAQRTLDDNYSKATKKRKDLKQAEADLVTEETALEAITESLKGKTQVFHDQITLKQQELAPWKERIDGKRSEIEVATSERDGLAKKAESVAEACKQAEENLQELKSDQQVKVAEHKKLSERKANLASELKTAEAHVAATQRNLAQCRTTAGSTRQTVAQARASQAEGKSQNAVLQALTKLANEGKVQGFHGRLGSLGKIADDKYDVAVTTACGMLNHLVTDRVEQGQACIEHLRRTNVGRASIMVLDKVQATPQQMAKKPQPEDVPRLFDLITPKDPKFACAFYKAVGETLVAKDMDQATRIAYGGPQRRRVVTLQGQMIEANGTMGGGGKAASGGMSSRFTADAVAPSVLRNYEQDNEKAELALQAAQQENMDAETRRDQLVASGPQISLEVDKLNMEIENGKKRIADAEKRVRELQSQNKPDAGDLARIKKLNADIKKWESELESLLENSSEIEAAIKDLEKRILDIGGSRLMAQRSKVEGVQFSINLLGDEITKAEVAYEKAGNDIKRLTASLKTNKADLVKAEEEMQVVETDLADIEELLEELRKTVDKAKGDEETWHEHLQTLEEEYGEMQEHIQAFKMEHAKRQNAVNAAQKAVDEADAAIVELRDLHDALRLEDIEYDKETKDASPEEGESEDVKADVEMEDVKSEPDAAKSKLPVFNFEQLKKMKLRDLAADLQVLQGKYTLESKGQPNFSVKADWKNKEAEFSARADDVDLVTAQRDAQKSEYEALRKKRLDEFMRGFNMISLKLKEMYQMITLGGNAELELVDSMDPFSEGIIFSVMPPKKSWKNISNLSGGEKTLSSLALVFALHTYKPTPLYFMDEIDAALDFRNVSIVANYIKDRTKNAQFIIISLRNNMFELSNRLIGIYKTSNATHSKWNLPCWAPMLMCICRYID